MTVTSPPPMVGIGASAGGLDAFKRVVENLPPDTGLAYLFVQHLDPLHDSALPEILGRAAHVPVVAAEDGIRVEADHAYVIPPNKTMTVTDGHLHLVPRRKDGRPHLPIDTFLISLADVHGSGAVAVILSGAGSDGARGIEAIKEAGGITMAQDAASASYPSMPEAAEATGCVDFVLTPEGIAEQLARLGKHVSLHGWDAAAAENASHDDEDELHRIFVLLKNKTGVDFQHYRRGTVHRRILRRMMVHRHDSRSDYLALLRTNPSELDVLYEDLLIGVTSFFRDPAVFESLQHSGFPEIMQRHDPDRPVRAWVAGCSGGEEAYSHAIALIEFFGDSAPEIPIQIFGTDLNETAISRARAGLYPEGISKDVSPDRLKRFFTSENGGYRINKAVRDLCVFSRQNLVRDPPFSHLDLISCRNVLIYLEPILQRRLFPIFHYALEPNGLLVLGSAESARSASEFFEPLNSEGKRQRIYHRRSAPTRPLDVDFVSPANKKSGVRKETQNRAQPSRHSGLVAPVDVVDREADRLVLNRFAPAGVVINEHMEITQFRGSTRAFLGHPDGAASLQLFKLVRSELVMPLRAAIRTASVERRLVREGQIVLERNLATTSTGEDAAGSAVESADGEAGEKNDAGAVMHVAIEVLPFQSPSTGAQFYVVLFENEPEPAMPDGDSPVSKSRGTKGAKASSQSRRSGETRKNRVLREENAATKRYLQAIVEEHEAANEELRAANEEIQSANEELQSTNEELETTKEEVQSTNEELTTVNEELKHRNRDLQSLSGDLMNVLSSTTIPIIIVGRDLRLRRFTPASDQVMKVIPTDAGRPLSDVRLLVALPTLEQLIQRTIETLEITQREVEGEDGRWWELTIRPYLTVDRRVDGATLVFSDIDASKRYGMQAVATTQARQELLAAAEVARDQADRGRELAEAANKLKSTFLASISHDLRTPLNAISGYTELVSMGIRGPVTPEQQQDMTRIKRSARHLLALINDILNFAKVEAGQLDYRIADVDVVPITKELGELVASQMTDKSLTFELSDRGDLNETANSEIVARADPEKLRQILLNLLTNAVKFTAPGGRIGIASETSGRDDGSDDAVRIVVWDTGVGIAFDQQEHIFEPFVQVNRGLTSPPPEGVGLGLAISRDLARGMNGELTVESTLGRGSRFTVTLPRGARVLTDAGSAPFNRESSGDGPFPKS
jgi:two-component system CheB/CheR fusion protein